MGESSIWKRGFGLLGIFVAGIALATGLLVASSYLPAAQINANIAAEAGLLRVEPAEVEWLGSVYVNHPFSEALALNQAMIDTARPVHSSLTSAHFARNNGQDAIGDLIERAETGATANTEYPRYWTGHIVWNRLLFLFTDLTGARMLNAFLVGALFFGLLFALWRWTSPAAAVVMLVASVPLAWNVMAYGIFFPPVFLVALGMALAAHGFSRVANHRDWDLELFLVAGMATTYFDSFSVPLFGLALPLVVALVCTAVRPSGDSEGGLSNLLLTVRASLAWLVGYGGLWAAKWVINEMGVAPGTIGDTIAQIAHRSGGSAEVVVDLQYRLMAVVGNMFYYIPNLPMPGDSVWPGVGAIIGVVAVVVVLWGGLGWLVGFRRDVAGRAWPLLLVALMPVAWMFIVAEHSLTHFTSVYRLTAITVLSLLTCAVITLDWDGAFNRIAGGVRQSDGEG